MVVSLCVYPSVQVCLRLGVQRGARYVGSTGEKRPYAADKAIDRRAEFDNEIKPLGEGNLKVGDQASSRGRRCTVEEIDYEANTCKLSFDFSGVHLVREYNCIYKRRNEWNIERRFPKGSARLRRVAPSLRPGPRKHREDAIAEAARPKVEEFFNAEGARSPSQRDEVRRRVGVGMYQCAQALYVYAKYKALYAKFLALYPAYKISYTVFQRLRPWYVRRSKQETCLCKHCENFQGYQEALHSIAEVCAFTHAGTHLARNTNRFLSVRFSAPSLNYASQIFEEALDPPSTDGEVLDYEDADTSTISSWEGREVLLKLLDFCRLKSKSEMVQQVLCKGAFEGAGKQDCINGQCASCGFDQLWSQSLRKHVVDSDGNVMASAPIEFQSTLKWTRIRSPKKDSGPGEAAGTNYEPLSGTIVQLLDSFELEVMKKYHHHRFTLKRQKAMAAEFERNRGPGWLTSDVDFAMDGTIPPPLGRAIQAEHWRPMGYTLFVQIVSWLETAAWVSRTSLLSANDFVTVEPSVTSVEGSIYPPEHSYWAEVRRVPQNCDGLLEEQLAQCVYGVRPHGAPDTDPLVLVERQYLRHRKKHTKAFIHISNDKLHDSHAAQTYMNKTFAYLEQHYVSTGKERFLGWHMHSDNASSHFKSSKTMNYLTSLPGRLQAWIGDLVSLTGTTLTFRVFWEFGAPGHGKGVWDGIGAWIKRSVRQDVIDHRPSSPNILTASGRILSPEEVAEHVKARFQTQEFVEGHIGSTINEVVVIYTPFEEIQRDEVTDHMYESIPGIKKTFLFMAIRESIVLQRKFACWCYACMNASAPGEGTMDTAYRCQGCVSDLPFEETSVDREDAAGVASRRARVLKHSRELRDQLVRQFERSTGKIWVAVQNRAEDEPDAYFIGLATGIQKEHDQPGTVGRVRYSKGDVEIAVEWFDRDLSGGDDRRIFKIWDGAQPGVTYTFNSTELRAVNVPMQLIPPVGGVELNVIQRGAPRAAAQRARNSFRSILRVLHEQRAEATSHLWEIPAGDEGLILHHCF